mmetsp:Transcript_26113/g.72854  ORF Transcript_26113/g.72854 Transcript_26113/m.72854 type:complete len:388 (-) Transcript_26113:1747-2910(-)
MDFVLRHVEHGAQLAQRKRVVLLGKGKEVGPKAFQLDLLREHGLDAGNRIVARHQLPHIQVRGELDAYLPISLEQCLRCAHDVVASLLRRTGEHLVVVHVVVLAERAGNWIQTSRMRIADGHGGCHVGNFQKHGAQQVTGFEQVEVDVLVVRNLATLFRLFLVGRFVVESAHALRQQFAHASGAHLAEASVRLVDLAMTERAHSQRCHHAVEQDHRHRVGRLEDLVLDVRHEQQIAGLQEAIVEGVMVDVADDCLQLVLVGSVLVHEGAQLVDQLRPVGLLCVGFGVLQHGLARYRGWVEDGVVGATRFVRCACGVKGGDRSKLHIELGCLVDLLRDGVVTVIQMLDASLCESGSLLRVAFALVVRLHLAHELQQLGLVQQTRHVVV